MDGSLTGFLLIAGPRLSDPNFFRTVVLLCGHDEEGALGVVLNRPSDIAVGDHLPGWVERLSPPEMVFSGGPVQTDVAVGVGRCGADHPPGWSHVSGPVGLIDLTLPPGDVVGDLTELRIFSGYAGWSPGQLEDELSTGDWVMAEMDETDVFGPEPEDLWRTVLRRQGGGAALYADFPIDPRAN